MKPVFLLISVLFLSAFGAKAQNAVDNTVNKANNSINSINNSATNLNTTTTNAVNTVGSTASSLKDMGNKLGVHLGKKHMASDDVVSTTVITVDGATYATLKQLNDGVKACNGVQDSKLKFSSSGSTITVTHTGTSGDLIGDIQKKLPDMVKSNQVLDVEEDKIEIKLQ